jgi:hypothetical protein
VAGQCFIADTCYAEARPDQTTCRVCDDASPTVWSPPATALACDDANACSSGDSCSGASCAGAAYSCDDGAACTVDACHGAGAADCTHTLTAGNCLIDGKCHANGAANPVNPCLFCDAVNLPTFWSAKPNGSACNDGDLCSYGDQCSFGSCLAIPYDCIDAGCCVGNGTCTTTAPGGVERAVQQRRRRRLRRRHRRGPARGLRRPDRQRLRRRHRRIRHTWARSSSRARGARTSASRRSPSTRTSRRHLPGPRIATFPTSRQLRIAGIGDFDADRFLDLVVAESVGDDYQACGAGCPAGERCIGGGCVPYDCTNVGCAGATGTQCFDFAEHYDNVNGNIDNYCAPPTRYHLARETCPSGAVGLLELFTLPAGDYVSAIIDVNNDGHLDFVVRKHWAARRGYVMLNAGDPGDIQFSKVEYRADGTTPMLPMRSAGAAGVGSVHLGLQHLAHVQGSQRRRRRRSGRLLQPQRRFDAADHLVVEGARRRLVRAQAGRHQPQRHRHDALCPADDERLQSRRDPGHRRRHG